MRITKKRVKKIAPEYKTILIDQKNMKTDNTYTYIHMTEIRDKLTNLKPAAEEDEHQGGDVGCKFEIERNLSQNTKDTQQNRNKK